jgi:CubicO group peptidase (beta-lactamase class C family)
VIPLTLLALFTGDVAAQNPGRRWEVYRSPQEAGWSVELLAEAESLYSQSGAAAVVVVYDGRILAAWGDVTRRFMCHSVRKSFLSALYGVYVDAGVIDIDDTLADLGIDDIYTLTAEEKRASIRDLLKARSGVYHSAAYETPAMKRRRPKRGSHPHGTFWYYNNWDFNVLGAVFEQETQTDIFTAFEQKIAVPLQMQHYRLMDGYHHLEAEHSKYPAYPFKLSALDMARFGLLFLREGRWNGEQLISREWVEESTTSYSSTSSEGRGGYAYLWWTDVPKGRPDRYFALGYGGQVIGVWPAEKLVFVQRVDTYRGRRVGYNRALALLEAVVAARVSKPKSEPEAEEFEPPQSRVPSVRLRRANLNRFEKSYTVRNGTARVQRVDDILVIQSPFYGNFRLFPLSKRLFFIEDMEYYAVFDYDGGSPRRVTFHATREIADFYGEMVDAGPETAIAGHLQAVEAGERRAFGEYELKQLGYQLLGTGRSQDAVLVFALNASTHPMSAGAWDSLAEAHMVSGNTETAVRYYRKSLELDPNNGNAVQQLERLGASVEP